MLRIARNPVCMSCRREWDSQHWARFECGLNPCRKGKP